MFSEAQLIAFAMMVLGGVALILTREKGPAQIDQQPGQQPGEKSEKDRRPAMDAAQA